jgi:hypothetical protein
MPAKHHVVFHRMDLDGIGSAMVILNYLLNEEQRNMDEIILHAFNYGEDILSPVPGDHVYIADVSFKPEQMAYLWKHVEDGDIFVTWIDHHKTAYDDSVRNGYDGMKGIRNLHRPSAVELCWNYFNDAQAPEGIKLLSLYDTWCNEDKFHWKENILPFQYGMKGKGWLNRLMREVDSQEGMRAVVRNFMRACTDEVDEIRQEGDVIMAYQKEEDTMTTKQRAFSFRFEGITFAVMNAFGNSNSFVGVPFIHEARMLFNYDPGKCLWRVSMYGVDDKDQQSKHDLSIIAKSRGGGGHKNACGFEVRDLKEVFGPTMGYDEDVKI